MNLKQPFVIYRENENNTEGTDWLLISDLMSGLLMIFALLVVVTLFQLKITQEQIQNKRVIVIQALQEQFNANGISAEINPETGDITLLDSVLFDFNKKQLKQEGKDFLIKFIPVYSGVIFSEDGISDEINRVIIEGHTSSDGSLGYNMQLSLGRANSVFQYIHSMPHESNKEAFLQKIQVAGRGPMDANSHHSELEDRKVIFRMQFKSEDAFSKVLKLKK
ncbi:Outer membrane protein and related peptidoglycan-associated (lipo)proteins-like protein [Psychromonas ingrahamii 37]|uniref:Outer membrane protein and related peptidoglycan-associated (Lipo)proteins-like protein n=1 Tax=Psychromonas ingrahamii (strain DSM 17664 / CCUG 51855 / 37) TaxID=357804 RepID=A1T031_PSYIN|nr:OmpA family protein [Psychromonas ingrahamii]ABM05096.1 Outer membrane protein and related peptidoglycan-associated (lipo)proteins-like protein [Psychromonas ingrahamii 37]